MTYLNLFRHRGEASLGDKPVHVDGPSALGSYHDTFVRTDDGWRFGTRTIELSFLNADRM